MAKRTFFYFLVVCDLLCFATLGALPFVSPALASTDPHLHRAIEYLIVVTLTLMPINLFVFYFWILRGPESDFKRDLTRR